MFSRQAGGHQRKERLWSATVEGIPARPPVPTEELQVDHRGRPKEAHRHGQPGARAGARHGGACGWRPRASGEGAMLSAVPPAFAVCRPCCGWGMQGGTEPGLKPAGEGPGDHESHVFLLEPKKKMVLPPLQIPATSRKSSQKLLRLSFTKDIKAEAAGSMVPPLPCLPLIVRLAIYGNLDSSSLGIVAHTCNLQETETGGSHDLGQPGLRGFLRPYLKRKGMCKCNDEMLI